MFLIAVVLGIIGAACFSAGYRLITDGFEVGGLAVGLFGAVCCGTAVGSFIAVLL